MLGACVRDHFTKVVYHQHLTEMLGGSFKLRGVALLLEELHRVLEGEQLFQQFRDRSAAQGGPPTRPTSARLLLRAEQTCPQIFPARGSGYPSALHLILANPGRQSRLRAGAGLVPAGGPRPQTLQRIRGKLDPLSDAQYVADHSCLLWGR